MMPLSQHRLLSKTEHLGNDDEDAGAHFQNGSFKPKNKSKNKETRKQEEKRREEGRKERERKKPLSLKSRYGVLNTSYQNQYPPQGCENQK